MSYRIHPRFARFCDEIGVVQYRFVGRLHTWPPDAVLSLGTYTSSSWVVLSDKQLANITKLAARIGYTGPLVIDARQQGAAA